MIEQGKGTRQAYLSNCLRTYSCVYCRAHLAKHDELISKQFLGTHGPAYLFNSVVNIGCGPAVRRSLSTGPHVVSDIYCDNCKTTLGWKYEQAFVVSQKYKEGKYIIELAHMLKENDWDLTSYNAKSIFESHLHSNGNGLRRQQHSNLRHNYYYRNYYNYDILISNNNLRNNDNKNANDSSRSTTQPMAISKKSQINSTHKLQATTFSLTGVSPSSTSELSSSCSPSSSGASCSSANVASSLEGPFKMRIFDDNEDEDDNYIQHDIKSPPIYDHDRNRNVTDIDNNNIDYDLDLDDINDGSNANLQIISSYSAIDDISQTSNGEHFYDCYSDNETMAIDDKLVMNDNEKVNYEEEEEDDDDQNDYLSLTTTVDNTDGSEQHDSDDDN